MTPFNKTTMAATSGQAGRGVPAESFANSSFTHAASGFRYRVSLSGGAYWMGFEKAADGSGELGPAEATLRKVSDLSPGFQPARDLLKRLQQARSRK
jgi:hypothetical protein